MEMLKYSVFGISVSVVLPMLVIAFIGLSPGSAYASTIRLSDVSNHGDSFNKPEHVPPVNPPIDTPAFYNGLVNTPTIMPANVHYHTLPGSGFGQAAVPVSGAAWLFGSGLLGLVGIARRKKAA